MGANLALSGGLAALRTGMSFMDADKTAKQKKVWQEYKNTMLKLSGANAQNTFTTNENIARESSAEQAFQIERSEYITSAQAEVAAAASGTEGRSVNAVMFDIERNAASAQSRRKQDLSNQYRQIDAQRQNSEWQVATQMDYSPIPEPNPATYMLNFAGDMHKLYRSSKP